ncbi:PKSKA1 [Biscogniauxia sp. FL1348]|nr:PKSKA1 [Biscogniauxia sp. FL1348]
MAVDLSPAFTSPTYSDVTTRCSSENEFSGTFDNASSRRVSGRTQVPVAVVGMGCRLPGHSNSPTTLWEFLQNGSVAKNEPPPTRFSLAGHYDKTRRPRTMKSPGGMFMEDVDPREFDGQFFNISRTDCIAMDPQQRQLLEVTYECLENAGVPLEVMSGTRTGVIVGTNFNDYGAIQNRDPEDRADSITIGLASSILSNRISHFLNVDGPSMTLDTACSASLVAVDVACRYLDSFQANAMLVAGANMWLSPEHNEEVGMMHMTQSATGKCHSFDAKADGYVKAEGINVVYLKRLDDAIRDGDPIRAVIRGTAAGASGRTAGIANPSPEAQVSAIKAAYKNAGISDFQATSFLECHGTGTMAGDPVETKAAASVFAKGREQGQELIIGSIKSNIGHSEAAAGLSGLIKAVMALEHGIIPGTPTFVDPNPNIDWKGFRIRASRTSVAWPKTATIRRASVNSFGFGGANAHAVLEQAPASLHVSSYKQVATDFFDDEDDSDDDVNDSSTLAENNRPPTLLVFSGNDQNSVKNYVKALRTHLLNPTVSIDLGDLAYTLSERRTRHYYRAFAVTRSSKAMISDEAVVLGKHTSSPPRIGFVFTGQGAQWSQMGKDLVATFPLAKKVIQDLDEVLASLSEPPKWSLLAELTEARSIEALRQPEFSQPLVTALQIALLEVLGSWGIKPKAVIGHSSGEIAAAVAAGLITPKAAIKIAYYRGYAAKQVGKPAEPVGMLAVGVGPEVIKEYLQQSEHQVQIACYNSPSSLTMSGRVSELQDLCNRLKEDGHFARMLLVDLAYHSDYMAEIGSTYEQMLLSEDIDWKQVGDKPSGVRMFSSVTGSSMMQNRILDATYWKTNMTSSVQFTQAATNLLSDSQDGADFLIELGPSNTLSGPIAQIKKTITSSAVADIQYTSTLKRGADSIDPMYNMAGQLFLAGGVVDLAKVNRVDRSSSKTMPKVIIDLPNYSWNHSTHYWHETQASKDWRFKKFIRHDLLGSKIIGTAWQSPTFKNILKLADVPWLRDHKLGSQVVFPGAAYVNMAVEAMYQTAMVTQWKEQEPSHYRYRLRDVKFHRALMLEESSETRITLALSPVKGSSTRLWYSFEICSVQEELRIEHSTGLVCVETDYQDMASPKEITAPLELAVPSRVWYKALADAGYNFGPAFQKHIKVEMTMGERKSRSLVNLEPPPSTPNGQSSYPMHPAVIDSCLQTGSPSLWKCDPSSINAVLVPKVIDSLVIASGEQMPAEGIALSSATFQGVGNTEIARNYATNVSLYDPQSGACLFEMKGLASGEIETSENEGPGHTFFRLSWDADVDMLMAAEKPLAQQWFARSKGNTNMGQAVIDLIAHKNPRLDVLELNVGADDASSMWIQDQDNQSSVRMACSQHIIALRDPKSLIHAQQEFSSRSPNTQFLLFDGSQSAAVVPNVTFDLAIVKRTPGSVSSGSNHDEEIIMKSLSMSVREGGFVVAFGFDEAALSHLGKVTALPLLDGEICICQLRADRDTASDTTHSRPTITHVTLLDAAAPSSSSTTEVLDAVAKKGWTVRRSSDEIGANDIVIILDELCQPLMDRLDEKQWQTLKKITQQRCRVLWVTSGAQLSVTNPTNAAITGLLRTIRAEEKLDLMSLDVEKPVGEATSSAISACLDRLSELEQEAAADYEFVERGGVVQISRVFPDAELTKLKSDEVSARKTETVSLHDWEAPVKLQCERLGNLDTIHFSELDLDSHQLKDGHLEIEIYAAGLNYKDVVVSMGIVPGDETALGYEAAGVITKVSPGVAASGSDLEVGQRVVVFGKGSFANRVQTTPGHVHRIPDTMTLEEAATLSVVYLTSIYSLFDIANITAGKRVLIHSAAGGVGIAAIQLAKYADAEVFATVGTDEKREFLKSTFGIQDDHIYYSRNTDFADQVLAATDGKGVDIVLNSLTGDMLSESFRILADGGIMVEIGKKDILDRNNLAMAPFDRNISFRAVDMSPERVSDALASRLMSKLFELIDGHHIKPISPIHQFSWGDIPSAIRFLRTGKHMGKIVISDGGPDAKIQVPVRRAPNNLSFRDDRCYLIVGGLRGLCGSIAMYLAKIGVKNLAVISRSGYGDEKSRGIIKQINALGAHIDLLTADVTIAAEVEKALGQTSVPVAGIIQGAMVLRDRPFDSMSLKEYHEAVQCKVSGTWNLHNAAEKLGFDLDFFTMLSSISGVIGNRGQANYSAANVFLDSFADFRHQRGQAACSVNLGVIEDAGYIAESAGFQAQHFDARVFNGINDSLLRKIVYLSILQQQLKGPQALIDAATLSTQMVTGLINPQPADSSLRHDARFAALFTSHDGTKAANSGGGNSGDVDVQALLLLLRSPSADPAASLAATVEVVNKCFVRLLRLSEPMDPARSLAIYGIDSLSAVEVRNWVRSELGALVTTLDIMNASSLTSFCQKVLTKIAASDKN